MDIAAAIATASQAIEITRTLRGVEKQFEAVELKGQVVDLMDKLLDVKSALQDAQEAMRHQADEIAKLKKAAARRDETMVFDGFRMLRSEKHPNQPQGHPFCPRCDAVDGLLIQTVANPKGMGAACPQCKAEYTHAPIYLWDRERT